MRSILNTRAALTAGAACLLAATALQAQTATTTSPVATESTNSAATNTNPATEAQAAVKAQAAKAQLLPVNTLVAQANTQAQTPTSAAGANSSAAGSVEGSSDQLTEVTVTGSRVITNGNDSPTPVTVVSVSDMANIMPSGNVADQLNALPQFSGSRGPDLNPSSGTQSSASAPANPAAEVLNLRNMGPTRTLILWDGHRVAPSESDGTVDTSTIPQLLLQRVDIVTGGASAVYGSDAVTGVVNFVTDTKFIGLKVNASTGISHDRDDKTQDFGIAWGTNLGDKGHFEANFETRNNAGILHDSDRPSGRNLTALENPSGGAFGPYVETYDVHSGGSSFGGLIIGGPLGGYEFSQNGVLTPFVNGTNISVPATAGGAQVGGGGSTSDPTLITPLNMNQLYVRFDYDFTDAIHYYAYVSGTYSATWQQSTNNALGTPSGGSGGTGTKLSSTDPFLPAAVSTALAKAGTTFGYGKNFTDIPATNVNTWERGYSLNNGVNVKLGGGYEWDTFFSHSLSTANLRQNAAINSLNLVAALNAVVNPANNQIVCAVTLTNPGLYPGCVPFNPFGPNAASQQAINYVTQVSQSWSYTDLDDATTSLTGAPFSTWAGPVPMALSAEWRGLSYHLDDNIVPNSPTNEISCTGLPSYDCTVSVTAAAVTLSSVPRSLVSQYVGEGALEFDVPLLKDVFLAKNVSFNGAARWTEYNTSGPAWTWKGGLVWHFSDELTFRATRSRDIRAPTLNDLYLPTTYATSGGPDYWTGVQIITPNVPFITKGNPTLVPEVGITTTAGLIWQPKWNWLNGFSVSVDAFKIDVTDAIAAFRGASEYVQLGCPESGGTSLFCELVVRPINCCSQAANNTYTELIGESLNLADQWTEGTDFEIDYAGRIYNHPFSVRALATWQPQLVVAAPGSANYNLAGAAFQSGDIQATPVWRATLLTRYSPFHDFTINVLERWRDPLHWGPTYAPPNNLIFAMPPITHVEYTDLTLSYLFEHVGSGQIETYLSVTNLFNRQPPPANSTSGAASNGFVTGDDVIGAYYTLGFRLRL